MNVKMLSLNKQATLAAVGLKVLMSTIRDGKNLTRVGINIRAKLFGNKTLPINIDRDQCLCSGQMEKNFISIVKLGSGNVIVSVCLPLI